MSIADFIIPFLAFAAIFNGVYFGLKDGFTLKKKLEIAIGILVVGFSWWTAWVNANEKENLNNKIDKLVFRGDNDSVFKKYIKDSFGIISQGGKPTFIRDTLILKEKNILLPTQTKINNPIIIVDFNTIPNPYLDITQNGDSLINIALLIKNGTAYIDSYRFLVFAQDGELYNKNPQIIKGSYKNINNIIFPETITTNGIFINRIMGHQNSFAIAIEVKYHNELKIQMPIFRKLFFVNLSKKIYAEANDDLYKQLSLD